MSTRLMFIVCFVISLSACSSGKVRFAAMGDTPYFESDTELAVVSDSFAAMAKAEMPFVIHVGDIMRGGTACNIELYQRRAEIFSQSPIPFFITIGDNEFNDCKDPLKARKLFRQVILNNPSIKQTVQGRMHDSLSIQVIRQPEMIENATWSYENLSFVMLVLPDMPGSYRLEPTEIARILDANLQFLRATFKKAKTSQHDAVVVVMHSLPLFCRLKACDQFGRLLYDEIKRFARPVLLLNGSDHDAVFDGAGYNGIENLWHIQPGSEPDLKWPEVIFNKQTKTFHVNWHEMTGE